MFYEEGNTTSWASWTVISDSIITLDFEINLFMKERFIKSYDVNWVFFKIEFQFLTFWSDTLAIPKRDV